MTTTLVRYRVKPGRAEENAELVRAVYRELNELAPPGFHYATFRDGDAFTHVAFGDFQLTTVAAFRAFSETVGERCAEPPVVSREPVGSYLP
jgi:hypothetical protein